MKQVKCICGTDIIVENTYKYDCPICGRTTDTFKKDPKWLVIWYFIRVVLMMIFIFIPGLIGTFIYRGIKGKFPGEVEAEKGYDNKNLTLIVGILGYIVIVALLILIIIIWRI